MSSRETFLNAIQKIICESQEIDKMARKVAEGCVEQGLKKVHQMLYDSIVIMPHSCAKVYSN